MAVSPFSQGPPPLGPRHTLGVGSTSAHPPILHPFPSALLGEVQPVCHPQGSTSGHLLSWALYSGLSGDN